MKRILLYFLLFLLAISCHVSNEKDGMEESDNDIVEINFNLNIPEAVTVTRSLYDDNFIRNIDLLVFDENNLYLERIKVDDITDLGSRKSFKVRIQSTTRKRIFHILANVRGFNNEDLIQFNWITGQTAEGSMNQLSTPHLSQEEALEPPFIMWGREEVTHIDANTVLGNYIQLLRTCYAVRVEHKKDLQNFELSAFTLLEASDRGIIAQVNYTYPAQTPGDVNIPSDYIYHKINYANSFSTGVWAEAYSVSDSLRTDELYGYESRPEQTYVILRASYQGSEYFYKLAFHTEDAGYLPLIRNHKYVIQINGVNGPGFSTFEEARDSQALDNIVYHIYDENDDIIDIIVDNQYELGLSQKYIDVSRFGETVPVTILSLNTVTGTPVLPVVEYDVDWITSANITGGTNGRYTLSITVPHNIVSDPERTAIVTVRAGSLRRYIQLKQDYLPGS